MGALKVSSPNGKFELQNALDWINKEQAAAGAAKIKKLADRSVHQGLIVSTTSGSSRASIVELNCETDFVACTEEFITLAADIAHTIAVIHSSEGSFTDVNTRAILEAPIISSSPSSSTLPDPNSTVGKKIEQATAKLGERIFLRRASCVERQLCPGFLKSYAHNSPSFKLEEPFKLGKIVSLVDINIAASEDGEKIAKAVARQCVALPTTSISSSWLELGNPSSENLLSQPFMTFPDSQERSVGFELNRLSETLFSGDSIKINDFKRWSVGEEISDPAAAL